MREGGRGRVGKEGEGRKRGWLCCTVILGYDTHTPAHSDTCTHTPALTHTCTLTHLHTLEGRNEGDHEMKPWTTGAIQQSSSLGGRGGGGEKRERGRR